MKEKESILIFSPKTARDLLKKGYTIIDIKPYRDNPDRTVFVFSRTEAFLNELKLMKEAKKQAKHNEK